MKRALILIVTWALLVVPISALAYENPVQSADFSVSSVDTILIVALDQDDGVFGSPKSDRGSSHCGHCAPLPILTGTSTFASVGLYTSLSVNLVRVPSAHLTARAEKPPRI